MFGRASLLLTLAVVGYGWGTAVAQVPQSGAGATVSSPSAVVASDGSELPAGIVDSTATIPGYMGSYSLFYQDLPVGPDGIVTEQLPEDLGGLYGRSPLDDFVMDVVRSTWVRLEYLHWNYKRPGDTILGAPIQGVKDPREPFPVTIGTTLGGFAHVESLSGLNLRDNQGIRATVGVALNGGTIEGSIFSFAEGRTGMKEDLPKPEDKVGRTLLEYIATSTLTNGEIGHNLFLYDKSFSAYFTSDFWGAEAILVTDPLVPGPGIKLRSIFGFRFYSLEERLVQRGEFDQNGFLIDPLVSTIDSDAKNRIYAPQIGLRLEYVHPLFTVGVEPKMVFGINVYKTRVLTDKLRGFEDPTFMTEREGTKFAPIGDFEVNGRLNLSRNFSLFVSYHILVAAGITRPQNNIYYDDYGPEAPKPGIIVKPAFDNMVIQGLSVGGELWLR